MTNRVSLWADPICEETIAGIFIHTSICVEIGEKKIIISYNENGVTCNVAVSGYFDLSLTL